MSLKPNLFCFATVLKDSFEINMFFFYVFFFNFENMKVCGSKEALKKCVLKKLRQRKREVKSLKSNRKLSNHVGKRTIKGDTDRVYWQT